MITDFIYVYLVLRQDNELWLFRDGDGGIVPHRKLNRIIDMDVDGNILSEEYVS